MRPLRPSFAWPAAFAATVAATWVGLALDPFMSVAGLAMVYLVALVACALVLPLAPVLAAAVLCACALNWFFIPPRHSFEVAGPEYWWTLAVLLVLSVAISTLVATLRERQARAREGEARAAQLHAFGEALAACGDDAEQMATIGAARLHGWIARPCAVFLREAGALRRWAAPDSANYVDSAANWSLDNARALGRGTDDWRDMALWCMPLARQDAPGVVQVLLGPHEVPEATVLRHWGELVAQLGLAIGRAKARTIAHDAQEEARAESARNTLLASLSHDLRTPLAGIVGTASTLREQGESLPPAQRERLLANLEHEARDLTLMADNVLQMARLAQPHQALRLQWESIEDILGAAAMRMRRRWDGAKIQLRVTQGLPPVQAEAALLAQVVANLVDNAVRHSGDDAHIIVTAGRSRGGIFVAVRDHGEGLPAGDLAQLFDHYRQGERRAGGVGLGLAICKLIVEGHGGRIEAHRCEPGCEFRIDLPVREDGPPPDG